MRSDPSWATNSQLGVYVETLENKLGGPAIPHVPISVTSRRVDTGEMMVTVIGEIDLASAPVVSKELEKRSGRVVVDLRKVDFMDSTGIRLLLAQHERLDQAGGHLRILVENDQQLIRLLEISGLSDIFDIAEALHPPSEDDPSPTSLV